MALHKDDVAAWGSKRVSGAMKDELDKLAAIRERSGGSFENVSSEDAPAVREANDALAVLGARAEEGAEAEGWEGSFARLSEALSGANEEHPGHGKPARRDAKARDLGALFTESEAFRAYKEEGTLDRTVTLPLAGLWPGYRGIGEVPGDGGMRSALFDSADYPIQPEFRAEPIEVLFQPNNIGPLMAQGTTTGPVVRYPLEVVTAQGATEIAEGITKPEADISFTPVDETVRKIAVMLPLTDESLEDVPFLRAYVNARLRLFVQLREDLQLLTGNGTAPNLRGILNRSGINTSASYSIGGANPDQALVDQTFAAMMRVMESFLDPDGIVMKPSTWQIARLSKDANRQYLLGPPSEEADRRLWGLRVILNANMPAQGATNKPVLVGAFRASAMVIRRSGIDLAVSDSHSTFFAENKVAIRAEERLALAVFRPAGFATVTSAA